MSTLGERIKILRGKTSQKQFAQSLGIPATTLANYENNKSELNFAMIRLFTTRFGVETNWLIFGTGPMKSEESECSFPSSSCEELPPAEDTQKANFFNHDKLERELELEKQERRELALENRKLHQEQENLLRENGELKVKIAKLEALVTSNEQLLDSKQLHAWLFTQNQSATADKPPQENLTK